METVLNFKIGPIPNSLTVLGFRYEIRLEKHSDMSDDTLGECDFSKQVIHIDPVLTPSAQWETLLHEVTHLCLHHTGAGNLLSKKYEELLCDAMGLTLFSLIKDNSKELAQLSSGAL